MPDVTFDYKLMRSKDFEHLLSGEGTPVGETHALEMIRLNGRSLLQARGGAGKSSYLQRLAAIAYKQGTMSLVLDSLTWVPALAGESDRLADADALQRLILGEGADYEIEVVVLLDGINEVSSHITRRLISAVDIVASRYSRWSFVLADRLTRREVSTRNWNLLGLTPVSKEFISDNISRSLTATDYRSLAIPFYLALALGKMPGTRAAQHARFLTEHASVTEQEVPTLAAFAYEQYEAHKDRLVDELKAREQLGNDLVNNLVAAGILVLQARPHFGHHLIADYLAAQHLAASMARLTYQQLDTLTFRASSFDSLALLLEMTSREPDEVVRDVFDWSFYGAGYLLSEDRAADQRITPFMEIVIVGMLGERMFDQFDATAIGVKDGLRVIGTPLSVAVLKSDQRAEIVRLITDKLATLNGLSEDQSVPLWFTNWLTLFSVPVDRDSQQAARGELQNEDPISGWTASNALRRSLTSDEDVGWAIQVLNSHRAPQVRWRAAHFLGASTSADASSALLNALDKDEEDWVKYGALRSLVEIAIHVGDPLAQQILDDLANRRDLLVAKPKLALELERTLPANESVASKWVEQTEKLVSAMWSVADSVDEQDRWAAVGRRIRESVLVP